MLTKEYFFLKGTFICLSNDDKFGYLNQYVIFILRHASKCQYNTFYIVGCTKLNLNFGHDYWLILFIWMKFRFSKNTTQFEILLEPSPCNHCNRDWYAMGVKVDFPSGEIILILAAMHCTLMQFVQFLCGPMIYNKTSTYATSRSVQRCGFGMGPIFFFWICGFYTGFQDIRIFCGISISYFAF